MTHLLGISAWLGQEKRNQPKPACHAERSEVPDNKVTRRCLQGFFAALRMTHLLGLSAWLGQEKRIQPKPACHAERSEVPDLKP